MKRGPGPGSACCRGAGSTCSIRRPHDIAIEDIAHGLARVARWNGQTHRRPCLLGGAACAAGGGRSRARDAGSGRALAAGGAAARCARVRDRRSHQSVQGRRSASTTRPSRAAAGGRSIGASACRRSCRRRSTAEIKAADRVAAYYEATRLAGFAGGGGAVFRRAARLRRRHDAGSRLGSSRPSAVVQAAFLQRFEELAERRMSREVGWGRRREERSSMTIDWQRWRMTSTCAALTDVPDL